MEPGWLAEEYWTLKLPREITTHPTIKDAIRGLKQNWLKLMAISDKNQLLGDTQLRANNLRWTTDINSNVLWQHIKENKLGFVSNTI